MLVNKAGRVLKVDPIYNREYYEKEIKDQLMLFRYLASHSECTKWLQVNSPEEIPDDLFQVVPYDEQKCIEQGIIWFTIYLWWCYYHRYTRCSSYKPRKKKIK